LSRKKLTHILPDQQRLTQYFVANICLTQKSVAGYLARVKNDVVLINDIDFT
jgi:hypothetical protein